MFKLNWFVFASQILNLRSLELFSSATWRINTLGKRCSSARFSDHPQIFVFLVSLHSSLRLYWRHLRVLLSLKGICWLFCPNLDCCPVSFQNEYLLINAHLFSIAHHVRTIERFGWYLNFLTHLSPPLIPLARNFWSQSFRGLLLVYGKRRQFSHSTCGDSWSKFDTIACAVVLRQRISRNQLDLVFYLTVKKRFLGGPG